MAARSSTSSNASTATRSELEALSLTPQSRRDPRRGRDGGRQREQGGERGGRARPPRRPGWPPIVIAVVVLAVLLAGALYAVGVLLPRKPAHTSTTQTRTTSTTTTHRTTATHTGTSHKHATKPKRVGVRLAPTGKVYVCLIGYTTANERHPHIRVKGVTLSPGQHEPTYHDNHFYLSLGNSSVVMIVNGTRHAIARSRNPTSPADHALRPRPPAPASRAPNCR